MTSFMSMNDSGVAWIGDIPSTWGIRALFQLASQVKSKNIGLQESNLLSLSYGKIKRRNIESNKGLLPESFEGYNIIERDDIVLRLTDLQNDWESLRVGLSPERGIITSAYVTLRPFPTVFPAYLYYAIHAYDLIKGFYGMGAGVRQGLNYSEVKMIKVPFPSFEEQRAIATYLYDQCTHIDDYIIEANASIEDYQKWKLSIIYEAVTKGIEPCVEMRDSGITWIGNIPSSWQLIKVKQVVRIENGSDPQTEGDIPVYGSGMGSFKTCGEFKEGPTVLLGRKGATLHIPHYIDGRYWNVDTAFNTVVIDGKIDLKFFYYTAICFDYPAYRSQTTLPSMTQSNYNNMKIPYPNIQTQHAIASFLDQKVAEIDDFITEKRSLIMDLELYKRSLIYEVVTGKRKVV